MSTFVLRSSRIQSFTRITSSPSKAELLSPFAQVCLLQSRKYSDSRQASASTTSQTVVPTSQEQTNSSISNSPSRINGPTSTLPAALTVPERKPDQGTPSYLFSIGKAYLSFYKTGGKAIWGNFKAMRPIQERIDDKYEGSTRKAIQAGDLDRHDFQLLTRSWFDIKRVPIFGLVFAVCGEFTPLVVMAVTSVVPYTCRIPRQIEGDRRKLESRRGISFRNLTTDLPADKPQTEGDKVKIVDGLVRMQLIHISWSLGLSSSAWDYLGGQFPGLPTFILRRKARKTVEYLENDDTLIARGGGVAKMNIDEVRMAAVERGIDILGRKDGDVKRDLEAWGEARRKGASIERLLLSRPNVWLA